MSDHGRSAPQSPEPEADMYAPQSPTDEMDTPLSPDPEVQSPPRSPEAEEPLQNVEADVVGESPYVPEEENLPGPEDAPASPDPEQNEDNYPENPQTQGESNDNGDVAEDNDSSVKRKVAVNSDSENDDAPPVKKRVVVESDDDEKAPRSGDEEEERKPTSTPKKRRVMVDSDDEEPGSPKGSGDEDERKRSHRSGSESGDDEGKRDEGESGDDDDEEEKKKKLVSNIFGDSSDSEGEGDEKEKRDGEENEGASQPKGVPDDDDDDDQGLRRDDDENGFEWDFDRMMREKKAEKKRKGAKRSRRGDGFDLINDDDGTVARMVEAMRAAAKDDRQSNVERKPALKKRKLLQTVKVMLLRCDMIEAMLDNGMMSAVSEWLAPLPDKSLPCLEIRTTILKLLQGFQLEQGILKQSGLGKAVMLLFKHPRETRENKLLAQKLISEWARPIFNLHTDFRSLSRDERLQRDYEQMPEQLRKKRESRDEDGPSTSSAAAAGTTETGELRPGDKGFIGRARVPKPSTRDYVVRPKSLIEGQFKGEKKARAMSKLDRTQREFNERTKKSKVKRAVGVSLEGRKMQL